MVNLKEHKTAKGVKKQQGNILVVFTIGLFALIAMAALALDGGHLLLNKSRLQNITDAAAMHAAKTLEGGGNHVEARAAVIEIIRLNLAHNDNFEINDALDLSSIDMSSTQITAAINVDFSETADPFDNSWTDQDKALYVKVEIRNLDLNNFLANIMNFSKRVSATALAGPSSAIEDCYTNLVPIMVCGDFSSTAPTDDDHVFGLPLKELFVLKTGANDNIDPDSTQFLGPGNYQFVDFGTGKNTVRDMLAGADIADTDVCFSTDEGVPTEPGNAVGPTMQGLNTRLEDSNKDEADYPRDLNTCQGPSIDFDIDVDENGIVQPTGIAKAYRYQQYLNEVNLTSDSKECTDFFDADADEVEEVTGTILPKDGEYQNSWERRILNVVIGDCSAASPGKTDIPYKGTGCFFLTQDIDQGGKESFIIGEFVEDCTIHGNPSGDAIDGNDTIVLFHVPDSTDS